MLNYGNIIWLVRGPSLELRDLCQLEIDTDGRKQLDLFIQFRVISGNKNITQLPLLSGCLIPSESNLLAEVMQLYIAGTDTTSSNLYWALLYVTKYPEIQQKIYEEITEHVGEYLLHLRLN